ncbi:MAG TPA: phosphate ABC transporter substrate-binding protein PstS, partial [Minicystis sp.]|nr:phosphate ABC transporter substrate-binding protein PstS [Minicystis sp.]
MDRFVHGLFFVALFAVGCGKADSTAPDQALPGSKKPAAGEQALTGAGSSFVNPLMSKWVSDYGKAHPGVKIDYQSIGSGGGIRQITQRTIDFGATDAPMTAEQLQKAPGILHVPLCLGAVVLAYHLDGVPSGLKLTPEATAGIFLGQIKSWDDDAIKKENPDAKLPNKPIATVHRSDGSGTTKIFVDYLSAVSPAWKSGPGTGTSVNWPGGLGAKGNEGVTAQVKSTPGAIGYVELAYAKQGGLTWVSLKNKIGNFIAPSLESASQAFEGVTIPDDTRV